MLMQYLFPFFSSGHMPDVDYTILTRWFEHIVQYEDCDLDLIGE
jgi:hypothetical protein